MLLLPGLVDVKDVLSLALLLLLLLAARADNEVLLLAAGESLALRELLGSTLVGLADLDVAGDGGLLLELLGKVLLVGLDLVLGGGDLLGGNTLSVNGSG